MALIKSIAEIRAVIPRLSKLSDTANLPNVGKAGRLYIIPIIGKELYADLNDKYNTVPETLTNDEKELLKNIQLPLAAFTLLDDMAFMHTVITDSGIRTTSTNNMEAAHRWEYKELQNALASYAADGVELLLQYLYETSPALWLDSDAFTELNSFLIKTGTDFKKYYPLYQPLRTYWALQPVMSEVEENYFASALGRGLLAWVKQQDDIIITVQDSEVDVKKLLKRSLAQLSIKHAGEQLAVHFDENGFTVLVGAGSSGGSGDSATADGRQSADTEQLRTKLDAANREGQNALAKTARYLVGINAGEYGYDGNIEDFKTVFATSPLNSSEATSSDNGNARRKIFRF